MRWGLLALSLLACSAWAQEEGSRAHPKLVRPGGLMLFYDSRGPLSFVTMTPGDLPPGAVPAGEVRGRSCQNGLTIPTAATLRPLSLSGALGDGGYQKVLEVLRRDHPELKGIYDVKVDMHVLVLLGIYRRMCTEILARGFR